jgi:hypothetical protein
VPGCVERGAGPEGRAALRLAAIVWLPTAIAFATVALGIAIALLCSAMSGRKRPDDDSSSDDGPGGSRRPPPRPPLPTGPVSWTEFEREFAAYVEHGRPRSAGPARASGSRRVTTPGDPRP